MGKALDSQAKKLKDKLSDRVWRLNNLYWITDKNGQKVKFRMNWAQRKLYNNMWYFNVILKARQLGFTTFICLYFLDACLFNSNHSAGIIAHTKEDAADLFDKKVKFAYDNLPDWIRESRKATQDSARRLEFSNGSSFTVGTSLRSGTYQKLHVSELGKLAAKYPEKAKEVKSGALNTVDAGQQIFVESTAEGKAGLFFDLCEQARKLMDSGKKLSIMEPKFHFYAWYDNPDYTLDGQESSIISISKDVAKYLGKFKFLTEGQKAWYAAKQSVQGEDMKKEYPSTAKEAFEGSLEGAFYSKEMQIIRREGQITNVPYDRSYQVHTFWDIGQSRDMMSIWFYQFIENQHLFIDYHESNNQGWDYYAKELKELDYNYGSHFFPHDGNKRIVGQKIYTSLQLAEQAGINPILIVGRTEDRWSDIQNFCKPMLPMCWFDEEKCAKGVKHLDNYRRRWDKSNGIWLNDHQHDEASHGADAYRTFVMAKTNGLLSFDFEDDYQEDFDSGVDRDNISGY